MTINGGSDSAEGKRYSNSKDINLTNFNTSETQNQNQSPTSNTSVHASVGQSSSQKQFYSQRPNVPPPNPKPRRAGHKLPEREEEDDEDRRHKPFKQFHDTLVDSGGVAVLQGASNSNSANNLNTQVNLPTAPLFYWENFGGLKQSSRPDAQNTTLTQSPVKMNSSRLAQNRRRKDEDLDDKDNEEDDAKNPLRDPRSQYLQEKENNIRINGLQQHYDYESARSPPTRYYIDTLSDNHCSGSNVQFKRIAYGLGIACIVLLIFSIAITIAFAMKGSRKDSGENSITEIMSGHAQPNQLIFYDDFEVLNTSVWRHDRYLSKDGFVIYGTNPNNSYVENGVLFIEPTFTSSAFNGTFLQTGVIKMGQNLEKEDGCSSFLREECEKSSRPEYNYILHPIMSASLRTSQSFTFKYGTIEMRAKMPKGDWIFTEVSLRPKYNYYGEPTNTEKITLISTRGNANYKSQTNQTSYGNDRICSKLIYSDTDSEVIGANTEFCKNLDTNAPGFAEDFHTFRYEWTPDFLKIFIDDKMIGKFIVVVNSFVRSSVRHVVVPGDSDSRESTQTRSFDQQFYIQLKVQVGVGFPDYGFTASPSKPWRNDNSGRSPTSFWADRHRWQPSWRNHSSALQVDYIKVTSLGK